jgi:hypothetical protein
LPSHSAFPDAPFGTNSGPVRWRVSAFPFLPQSFVLQRVFFLRQRVYELRGFWGNRFACLNDFRVGVLHNPKPKVVRVESPADHNSTISFSLYLRLNKFYFD